MRDNNKMGDLPQRRGQLTRTQWRIEQLYTRSSSSPAVVDVVDHVSYHEHSQGLVVPAFTLQLFVNRADRKLKQP